METHFICSYVIPYYHTTKNFKMLTNVLNALSPNKMIQVIIIETGNHAKIHTMDLKADYKFIKSDTWNLGWLYNIGAKLSKTDNLFFGDFSFLPRMDVIQNVVSNHGDRHCIYCQTSIKRLTQAEMEVGQGNTFENTEDHMYEGITFYTKDGFIAGGGYDENVFNHDLFILQDRRNRSMLNVGQVDGVSSVKMLVDEVIVNSDTIDYSKKHLDKLMSLGSDKIKNYIRIQSRKNGYSEKYHKSEIMNP